MSDPDQNSFLNQLQSKLKKGLKPTTTKTTFPDGSIQLSSTSSGVSSERQFGQSFGFVVDSKPDLSLGIVKPWLLISSQDVPNDENLILQNRITHILSLLPGFTLQTSIKSIVRNHLILNIYDEDCFQFTSEIFNDAFNFIEEAERTNGTVLIHCNAGISRAPSVTIAYLILRDGMKFEDAWKLVKLARPNMKPNAGFANQLKKLEVHHDQN